MDQCLDVGRVWLLAGRQSGRSADLSSSARLAIRAPRYSYEVESLVRAVRAGVPVHRVQVPVLYPVDRISHFRGVLDTWRTVGTFARLIVLAPFERRA